MFWNAFVWGLGVSCGGAIGLFGFMLTWLTFKLATGSASRMAKSNELSESLAALRTRNELSAVANAALLSIASSLKKTDPTEDADPS